MVLLCPPPPQANVREAERLGQRIDLTFVGDSITEGWLRHPLGHHSHDGSSPEARGGMIPLSRASRPGLGSLVVCKPASSQLASCGCASRLTRRRCGPAQPVRDTFEKEFGPWGEVTDWGIGGDK